MEITTATTADLAELVALLGVLFAQEEEFAPDAAAQTRGLRAILANAEAGFILLAREGDKALGMVNVLFTISTALGARVGIVEDVVVTPVARGNGVGTLLLQAAVARAQEQGCKRLTLITEKSNTKAHRFYGRHGFELTTMVRFRRMLD